MDNETRAFINAIREDIAELKADVKVLASCVEKLHAWRGWMMGAMAGLGCLGGIGGVLGIIAAMK